MPPPTPPYKSKAVDFLDEFFSGPDLANRLNYARAQLLKPGPLDDTTSDLLGALPAPVAALPPGLDNKKNDVGNRKAQFRNTWLNGIPGAEPKMRAGYLRAVNLAIGPPPKPLETFWIADDIQFWLDVINSPTRVTVFVHTTRPRPVEASLDTESASFAIGRLETDGEPSLEQLSGPPGASAG
jgi:hypothetical protein